MTVNLTTLCAGAARVGLAALVLLAAPAAEAQPLGTFRWQLQPYCNVVTVAVTQNGSVYRLEGNDDRCGAGSASVIGTAFLNPNGTLGFGLNIVEPGGSPVHVDAVLPFPALNGSWRDSGGHSGAFIFTVGAGSGGSVRPAAGPVGAANVDASQVQLRVSGSCPAGQYMQSVGQTGAVTCSTAAGGAGGTITSVTAGAGLSGGGASGGVTMGLRTTAGGSFDLQNVGGVVAEGTVGVGALAASGAGVRMLWHPAKAALRAGRVTGTQWDAANIGLDSIALGRNALASQTGDTAIGYNVTAVGGASTAFGSGSIAAGLFSTVMGHFAETTAAGRGSFVYGDDSGNNFVTSALPNQFLVRAGGGVVFWSSADTSFPSGPGVALYSGTGGWSSLSDVNSKAHFRDLAGEDVLARIAAMPVREWSYKSQPAAIRHVGPTAQDFHAAFGLGEDARRINSIDADGIALAAVRALEARTRELDARHQALAIENAALRARLDRLEARAKR